MTGTWWQVALSLAAGLAVIWLLLVAALFVAARRAPDPVTMKDVLRLVPDVVRLVRRLAGDSSLPRGVRWRLWALLGYLVVPIDLVPDFLPVIGYADDAVVIALVLRSVTRAAGPAALDRHWPGTPEGLAAVRRLVGLQSANPTDNPTADPIADPTAAPAAGSSDGLSRDGLPTDRAAEGDR